MQVVLGDDAKQLRQRAINLAADRNEALSTLHLLLALTQGGGYPKELLARNEVGPEQVRKLMKTGRTPENPGTIDRVFEDAGRISTLIPGRRMISALHVLAAMTTVHNTLAHAVLRESGCNPEALMGQVVGVLTGTGHRMMHIKAPVANTPMAEGWAEATASSARQTSQPQGEGAAAQIPLPAHGSASPANHAGIPAGSGAGSGAGTNTMESEPSRTMPAVQAQHIPIRPPSPWALDPKRYPVISGAGQNLNELAARGKLDPLTGRRKELETIMDVLGKRRANSPCLVGEPGVGKTAIAEGLASLIVRDQVPEKFRGRVVVRLGVSGLVGGTGVRGALGERLVALRDEVEKARGRIILFLDDVHELLRAAEAGGEGVIQEMKEAMERGALPSVCTTTPGEWKKMSEGHAGFARCLTPLTIEEPDVEATLGIVGILSEKYASFHGVKIEDGALHAAVALATRYLPGRHNPEKSLAVLDMAAARASRGEGRVLDREEVARAVSEIAGVPRERLSETDTTKLLALEQELSARIVGHPEAIHAVAATMRRNAAGFHGRRPIGSFLFLGPTGVGKTETSKAMADIIFSRPSSFVRFDMSEFSEQHSVARLVGAPPGYVGFERGGELTGALLDSPYKLVLFDEFEKAHPSVHRMLLQVLDDGRLTDAMGRTVDFSNTIIVLTSNLGSNVKPASRTGFAMGAEPTSSFASAGAAHASAKGAEQFADYKDKILAVVRDVLPPELFNRIDEPIVFTPLSIDDVREIARRLLEATAASLAVTREVALEWNDGLVEYLIESGGYDASLGARPMKRTIQRLVESPLAELVLSAKAPPGCRIRVAAGRGKPPVFRIGAARTGKSGGPRPVGKERRNAGKGKRKQGEQAA